MKSSTKLDTDITKVKGTYTPYHEIPKRYTERIRENEYATGNAIIEELKIDENNEDKDYILEQQKNIINTLDNKLGKIEDLFDSYSVEDLQELDKLLGMATAYEELSKQIGYPLEVLINAQVNGFYGQIGEKTVFYNPNKNFIVIDFYLQRLQVALNGDFYNVVTFYFDDYKKTFWLKEDKSE